jgi:5'-nucleotidase (lipoprotein e(P4) family)
VLRLLLITLVVAARPMVPAWAQALGQTHLEIKYVRDSEEYWTLAQQVYRGAQAGMVRGREGLSRGAVWGVVLDVDETALDNSIYQLDRASYSLAFDTASWNSWVRREEAPPVPGVVDFVRAVRAAGGRVAYVTNRDETVREATRRNLAAVGLWQDGDRLCLQVEDRAYTKAVRRGEVRRGAGRCGWEGQAVQVVVYVGDQMGDFPGAGEEDGGGGPALFGVKYFLLPQPLYGNWTTRVTRPPARP